MLAERASKPSELQMCLWNVAVISGRSRRSAVETRNAFFVHSYCLYCSNMSEQESCPLFVVALLAKPR